MARGAKSCGLEGRGLVCQGGVALCSCIGVQRMARPRGAWPQRGGALAHNSASSTRPRPPAAPGPTLKDSKKPGAEPLSGRSSSGPIPSMAWLRPCSSSCSVSSSAARVLSCTAPSVLREATHGTRHCHPCSAHLQLGELLGLVAGVLGVDELGEQELLELGALRGGSGAGWAPMGLFCGRHPGALTFLKTAGSGSGGPKKGTSSRAVTDTL